MSDAVSDVESTRVLTSAAQATVQPPMSNARSQDVENNRMLTFAAQATVQPPMDDVNSQDMDGDVRSAIEWISKRSDEQIIEERERAVAKIETLAIEYWSSGQTDDWSNKALEDLRVVIKDVCGPLAEGLVTTNSFEDPGCVESLRTRAPLVEELPAAAAGSEPHPRLPS